MKRSHTDLIVVAALAGLVVVGCGRATDTTTSGARATSEPSSTVGTTVPSPAVGVEKLQGLQGFVGASPAGQMYERLPLTSFNDVASAPNVHAIVTGTVTSVHKSTVDHFSVFPGQESAPNGKDLSEMGVDFEITVDGATPRSAEVGAPPTGSTLTVRIPLWFGQPKDIADGDAAYQRFLAWAPIGARALVAVPGSAALSDGSLLIDTVGLVLSSGDDSVPVPVDAALAPAVEGKTMRMVVAEANAAVVHPTPVVGSR